jgi:hypothetical protein
MISTSMPARLAVCWNASAMPWTGCTVRTSIVTLKPLGTPALASSALALSTSSLYGFSVLAPSRPTGRKFWWTTPMFLISVSPIAA